MNMTIRELFVFLSPFLVGWVLGRIIFEMYFK